MQFTIALVAFVAAASALSVPARRQLDDLDSLDGLNGLTTGQAAARCGNGQVLSCCNKSGANSDGSLLGSLAEGLIGGNCDMVPINIIGVNGILMSACEANVAACCSGDEDGLANVACDPITA